MSEKIEKHVDESWKETAQTEKEVLKDVEAEKSEQLTPGAEPANQPESEPVNESEPVQAQEENVQQPEASSSNEAEQDPNSINFLSYTSSLGYQAMIFLGVIPHPMTNEPDVNVEQAKFIIDTLAMLKEKTKGNLNEQEEAMLSSTLYELQVKYVESQKSAAVQAEKQVKTDG